MKGVNEGARVEEEGLEININDPRRMLSILEPRTNRSTNILGQDTAQRQGGRKKRENHGGLTERERKREKRKAKGES